MTGSRSGTVFPPGSPPHLRRLLKRLVRLSGPVLQIWGWPGTGKRALMEALLGGVLDRQVPPEARGAHPLALGELDTESELVRTLEDPEVAKARYLVCLELPESFLPLSRRLLRPHQRLVGAGTRRFRSDQIPVSYLTPRELLLTEEEAVRLWREETGGTGPELERRVVELTGGWLRLLRLVAEELTAELDEEVGGWGSTGTPPTADALARRLLTLPAVDSFLRHEVLEVLPPGVREALHRVARQARDEGGWPGGRIAPEVLGELRDWGWAVPGRDGVSLPPLLGHFLAGEEVPVGDGTSRTGLRHAPAAPSQAEAPAAEGLPLDESPSVPRPGAAGAVGPGREGPPGPRSTPRPHLQVALLGTPRVWLVPDRPGHDEAHEIHWPLRRTLKILAFLASAEGFAVAKEDLMVSLWPEEDEAKVERNFHPTLSHFRRTLTEAWAEVRRDEPPAPLLFVNGTYRLNPEIGWWVDAVEFGAALERGRALVREDPRAAVEVWQAAAGLYRGPFLSGVYDAWTEPLRERYQRRWLDLLRELGDLYLRLERLTDAIDAYRRVLIEDPLRERVHLALMRVYSRQGRRDLVRRQYDRLTTLLSEELGVEPLPQTTDEYHRLMV